MIDELIKEYKKLEEGDTLLWKLVFIFHVQDHLPPEANKLIDDYFGLNEDE